MVNVFRLLAENKKRSMLFLNKGLNYAFQTDILKIEN
jgi:hypothetical protein